MMSRTSGQELFFGDRATRWMACTLGALIVATFAPALVWMVREWVLRPEASHGFLMPPFALWLVWTRRHRLAALRRRNDHLVALAAALALLLVLGVFLAGEMGLTNFFGPYAFVATLGLAILLLYGWEAFASLLGPLVVLLLMCPLPGRMERALTLPLKNHAAILATGLLDLTGLPATLEGNMIHLPGIEALWVADACSGIRSLISLTSVAVLACFFWNRHWILKVVLVASSVPIAVVVNGLRLWLTGFLSVHVSPEAAQGFFHICEGFLLFAVAALALWGCGALLGTLFPRRPRMASPSPAPLVPTVARGGGRLRLCAMALAAMFLGVACFKVWQVRLGARAEDPRAIERLIGALQALPDQLGGGRYLGHKHEFDPEMIKNSGADSYASMIYADASGRSYQVYSGGSVGNTETFHTPSYCMPSSGWETLESTNVPFTAYPVEGGGSMKRLLLQYGNQRMVVYYWFQSGEVATSDEFEVRWDHVKDRWLHRPLRPTAIVTIYVPVLDGIARTETEAADFMKQIGPHIRAAFLTGGING